MFLDKFSLDSLTVQLQYDPAFIIWDNAGSIAKELMQIWPDLELVEGNPYQQTLKSKVLQVQSGIKVSTITLVNPRSLNARTIEQISSTFRAWRSGLSLEHLTRVSTRGVYELRYDTLREATKALLDLGMVRWPPGNMFDQAQDADKNALEVAYKFEDEKSFSFLRIRSEELKFEVKLEHPFSDNELKSIVCRVAVDFDRGMIGSINATTFRMDDWMKGFQHVLRRDIDKITTKPQ